MKKKLLFLIFLTSSIYQLSIGEEKNITSQDYDGYRKIEGIPEVALAEKYAKIDANIDIEKSNEVFILGTYLYIKRADVENLENIKGSIDIVKSNQVVRTINFDFSDQSVDIKSHDKNGASETRVFLNDKGVSKGVKTFINLGTNDLKDIVIVHNIFVKNTDSYPYIFRPQANMIGLNSASYDLIYLLNLPEGSRLHSIDPNEY